MLTDVVGNVMLAHPPAIDSINAEPALLFDSEGADVEDARQQFMALRRQLLGLRQQVGFVR